MNTAPGSFRKSYKQEIFCGPEPDVMPSLENEGLEVPFHAHYSRVGPFHRNAQFTKGCDKFILHVHKDEGLNEMYQRLPETNPMRQLGGENASDPHAGIPSLAALKGAIHRKVQEVWGPLGYVNLRQRLCELCDHEGFIRKSDVVEVLREPLGLSEEEVEAKPLDVWLCQLCTMKKDRTETGLWRI
eukprot:g3929.t1